jgi:hypothetical protein
MFLDRVDEARASYLKFRGVQKVADDKPWEAVILEDFADLRKAGLIHPLMDEIREALRGRRMRNGRCWHRASPRSVRSYVGYWGEADMS